MSVIPPGSVIGILGGGQLGRMTAMAAARLGYRCHILAPEAESPAGDVAAELIRADYEDEAALERFAAAVDVVTLEFENVPTGALLRLAERVPVRPGAAVLETTQDRLLEKAFLASIGVPVTAHLPVDGPEAIAPGLATLGGEAILKTRRLGYDGKGQLRIGPGGPDGAEAWNAIGRAPSILEAVVDFSAEVSVVTARGVDGSVASFPVVENRHENHILRRTIAPAEVTAAIAAEAVTLAERVAREIGLVGLLAVEMFLTRDGRLLVNELAPRPHNSGHWTIDACPTSQFEQLVRAVCGLPLGDPTPICPAMMDNLLGDEALDYLSILAEPGARLHLYGKSEARPGRKMGHVTRLKSAIAAG